MIWLDLETRSLCDLKSAGVYNYAQDLTTEVLCMSYAVDDGEVLTQILALVGYLDKRFPQAHILPGWLRIPPACGKRAQESRGPDDRGI